jgi:hypothetical protein
VSETRPVAKLTLGMYRKSGPPLVTASLMVVPPCPRFPSFAPSQPATFLAALRLRPYSQLAPFPNTSLRLQCIVSLPQAETGWWIHAWLYHHKRLSEVPAYAARPRPHSTRLQNNFHFNASTSWTNTSSANAVSTGRTMAQRTNARLVFSRSALSPSLLSS